MIVENIVISSFGLAALQHISGGGNIAPMARLIVAHRLAIKLISSNDIKLLQCSTTGRVYGPQPMKEK
jgi:hypothetical protein